MKLTLALLMLALAGCHEPATLNVPDTAPPPRYPVGAPVPSGIQSNLKDTLLMPDAPKQPPPQPQPRNPNLGPESFLY